MGKEKKMKKSLRKYSILFPVAILVIMMVFTVGEYFSADTSIPSEKIYVNKIHMGYNTEKTVDGFVRVSDMSPGSTSLFYYPDSQDIHNRDVFQAFNLIRLPEYLGGAANDTSAFRAYSALDLVSHCYIKYWPDEGRNHRIEDPCNSSGYRVYDGVAIHPHEKVIKGSNTGALPQLDLSIDDNGFLMVESPTFTREENGVIGVGRDVSDEEILAGSKILLDAYSSKFPESVIVPLTFDAGYYLHFVDPGNHDRPIFEYYHPTSRLDTISLQVIPNSYCIRESWTPDSHGFARESFGIYDQMIFYEIRDDGYDYVYFDFCLDGHWYKIESTVSFDKLSQIVIDEFVGRNNN